MRSESGRRPSIHRSSVNSSVRAVAVAAALVVSVGAAHPLPVSWIGANQGFWDLASNWSQGGVPGITDDLLLGNFDTVFRQGAVTIQSLQGTGRLSISGGSLSFSQASSIGSLALSGGTLDGAGSLTVAGPSSWTSGAMTGTGATLFNGALALSGNGSRSIIGRSVTFAGTTSWTNVSGGSSGAITAGSGASLLNTGSFLDQTSTAAAIQSAGGPASTFINSGTYTKSGATVTTVGIGFTNSGTVNLDAGTLALNSSSTTSGNFNLAAGSTLSFSGSHVLSSSAAINGSGRVNVASGTLTTDGPLSLAGTLGLSGGTLTANGTTQLATLDLSSGTLNGSGTVTASGPSSWATGTMSGTGATLFNGALALSGNGSRSAIGRSVTFGGTTTWTNASGGSSGAITAGSGASLLNTGSFLDQTGTATAIQSAGGAASTFINAGTYTKSGATVTTVGIGFTNSGTVNLDAGTLALNSTSSSSGSFNLASGSTLSFSGSHALSSSAAINGSGRVNLFSGTLTADGPVSLSGVLGLSGGTFSVNGNAQLASLEMGSGTLGSTGTVTASGPSSWTSGTMSGSGATLFNNTLALSGNGSRSIVGRNVTLAGTTTWTNTSGGSGGVLGVGSGAALLNTGLLLDQLSFSTGILTTGGAASTFTNAGTYTKSGATTTTVSIGFNNSGIVNLDAGTLSLSNTSTSSGSFNLAAGSTLSFSGAHALSSGAALNGSGRVNVASGSLTTEGPINLPGTLALSGGTLTANGNTQIATLELSSGALNGSGIVTASGPSSWISGTLSGTGTTLFNGALALSGNGSRSIVGRNVTLAGTTTWTNVSGGSGGVLGVGSGATLLNTGLLLDQLSVSTGMLTTGGVIGTFSNAGTYLKSGAATTTISIGVNNSGTLSVTAGTMNLTGGLSNFSGTTLTGGSFKVAGGGKLGFTGANIVNNAASIEIDGALSTLVNASTSANALLNLASNTAAGQLGISNGRNLATAGAFSNAGLLNVGSLSTFAATTSFANQASGQVQLAGGSLSAASLTNAGLLGGFGNVSVQVAGNTGSVRASGGTLSLSKGVQGLTGTVGTTAGSTLVLSDSVASSAGLLSLDGTALALGSQNLSISGDYTNAGFGSGNAFDRRAGVSGAGLLLATGTTAQTLSGAAVTNGASAQATLDFGITRVGSSLSSSFAIQNAGSSGPALRGAIQNLGLSDSSLGGSGTEAQSWGALAAGAAQSFNVSYTPTSGGTLSNQSVAIVNNFDNVAGQTLRFTGTAYNLATAGAVAPSPVLLANQRVGANLTQALSLSNTAAANGYSESLDATVNASGSAWASGSINALAAGATNSTALTVGVDSSSAGAKSGLVTLNLASNGTGSSGLATLALAAQQLNVSGAVYRLAQPLIAAAPLSLAARVGDLAPSAAIGVTNSSPDVYTERLNALIGSAPAGFGGSGTITGLAAGASSNALTLSLNTGTAGQFGGNAALTLISSGAGTTLASDLALANAAVAVSGRVYAPAVLQLTGGSTVDFGIVRVGDTPASRQLSVGNAANGALNDSLSARLGSAAGPFSSGGSFSGLAAGAVDGSSLVVALNTGTAGVFTSTAALQGSSHNPDLADLELAGTTLSLRAQVNNIASAVFSSASGAGSLSGGGSSYLLDFGSLVQGEHSQALLLLGNGATGTADTLAGSFDLSALLPGTGFSASGFVAFGGLQAGSALTGLQIDFSSSTVGRVDQVIYLNAVSRNASNPDLALATVALHLQGSVAAVPEPSSYALLIGGLALLAGLARRRRAA